MTAAEYLDQLDALRAAVPKGSWELDSNGCCIGRTGAKDPDYFVTDRSTDPDDAALIVAAVNALPQLIGALQTVLELHANDGQGVCDNCGYPLPCPTAYAITAALTEADQ